MAELDPEITAALHTAFGAAAGAIVLEPLAGGRSGAQLFTFTAGGAAHVLRRASSNLADPGRPAREVACMTIAAERGVGPALVHADPAHGIVIMARIDGGPIHRGTPRDTDPLGRLAATLRRLHTGPAFPVGLSPAQLLVSVQAAIAAHGAPALPAELVSTLETTIPLVEEGLVPVSCHRDLNPSNILATADHIYLVDWEMAGQGDRFSDLGQLGVWVCRDAAERAHLLASYLERAPTADELRRAHLARVLALGFFSAAFHMVSAFARRPVVLVEESLATVLGRVTTTGQMFTPDAIAAALFHDMREAVRSGE
jgi:aminoglycoside phosphotransferase (APT) family kinase protein